MGDSIIHGLYFVNIFLAICFGWVQSHAMLKYFSELFEGIWKAFCPPKRRRLEFRFVHWEEADELMRSESGWSIAPEEDNNRIVGWVYLERLEPHSTFEKEAK